LLVAALLAGSTIFSGAVASADDPIVVSATQNCAADNCVGFCSFAATAQQAVTGGTDTFTGVAYGFVATTNPESVTIRCTIRVDGAEVASTPTGSGSTVAVTAGQVTYTANEAQSVELCIEWNGGEACADTTTQQVPPEEFWVLVNEVFQLVGEPWAAVDLLACPLIAALAPGIPGLVDITPEGDVHVAGELVYDCPPYEVHG
jgi:hypothetical protein